MNWTELLTEEIENVYGAAEKLMDRVDDSELEWKPATGDNWMNMGQLLKHITESCGFCFRGFATGDWGLPEGKTFQDLKPEEMLPPAETLPTVASVAEAKQLLAADKKLAYETMAQVGEETMATKKVVAPWDPTEHLLGHQFLGMVSHLAQHKGQLFYYLKLQGKPVNTMHLYGA